MITSLKVVLLILCSIVALLFAPALTSLAASFNPLDQACSQGTASTGAICKQSQAQGTTNPVSGPSGIINKAANIVALVVGVGAVIMILIGGFEYVTGGGAAAGQRAGDPNAVKKAKTRITSALIGLVVVALAWVLVRLITDRVIK